MEKEDCQAYREKECQGEVLDQRPDKGTESKNDSCTDVCLVISFW